MGGIGLTQNEADRLLSMVKRSVAVEIYFPTRGEAKEFDVIGDTKKDIFTVSIFKGAINLYKCNYGARIKKNGVMLLELHISPSNVHYNPDGKKLIGNHWHIYTEKYGRSLAFPAGNIDDENFVDNAMCFLKKFNVIEYPKINEQIKFS